MSHDPQQARFVDTPLGGPVRVILPSEVRERLIAAFEAMPDDPYQDWEQASRQAAARWEACLPADLLARLRRMGHEGLPGALILEQFPVDPVIPSTETVAERVRLKGRVSERAKLGLVYVMGYIARPDPALLTESVMQVAPVKGKEHTASGKGQAPFSFHNELSFYPDRTFPKFLMLTCLESDPDAQTSLFYPSAMLARLPERARAALRLPVYRLQSDMASFEGASYAVLPVLSEDHDGRTVFRCYEEDVPGQRMEVVSPDLHPEAVEALALLQASFVQMRGEEQERRASGELHTVSLQPGEALIITNGWGRDGRITGPMHGRYGVIANKSRWLQRVYFSERGGD